MKINKPDAFMAKDMENSFRSIWFYTDDYESTAIVIPSVRAVGSIRKSMNPGGEGCEWLFGFEVSAEGVGEIKCRYRSEDTARYFRHELLVRIEGYYAGRGAA